MLPEKVAEGSEYVLPVCCYLSDGKVPLGWSVLIGETDAGIHPAGGVITVTADITVTAVWGHAVSFALGDPEAEGDMKTEYVGYDGSYTLPVCEFTLGRDTFAAWQSDEGGFFAPGAVIKVKANITMTAVWMHDAGFSLPDRIDRIEESAFEEDASIIVVDAKNCRTIGAKAFAYCSRLSEIHLPADCTIDGTAFEGSGTVYVFAPAGGTTEAFCAVRNYLIFVAIP